MFPDVPGRALNLEGKGQGHVAKGGLDQDHAGALTADQSGALVEDGQDHDQGNDLTLDPKKVQGALIPDLESGLVLEKDQEGSLQLLINILLLLTFLTLLKMIVPMLILCVWF